MLERNDCLGRILYKRTASSPELCMQAQRAAKYARGKEKVILRPLWFSSGQGELPALSMPAIAGSVWFWGEFEDQELYYFPQEALAKKSGTQVAGTINDLQEKASGTVR